jgi:hypothetical protein
MAGRRAFAAAPLLFFAALSCAGVAPRAPAPAPPRAGDASWHYDVVAGTDARELTIEVAMPPGPARRLSVDDGAEPFVRDVEVEIVGGEPRPVVPSALMWSVPPCPPRHACRVRYRFLLAEAAAAFDTPGYAQDHNGVTLSPPSTWLLRPMDVEGDPETTRFRLRVSTPEDISFVSGIFPSRAEPGAFEASMADLPGAPYSAFGAMDIRRMDSGAGTIQVAILPGALDIVGKDALLRWVSDAARSVTHYYGRYPVHHALVLLLPERGKGLGFASALGNGGASIIARVGRGTTEGDLADGWEMTHEMIHVAFPNLDRRHAWLEEGLATYVEPIARARVGLTPPAEVWRGLVLGLPKGLPSAGDRGLDNTPTWGRTYWGGAMFCLLADIGIRERTGNARSLDDALRGILAAGGNISVRWDIAPTLAEGDRATGVPVLSELYAQMKDAPAPVDLDALWERLGVRFLAGEVAFDDGAPLARIRASITDRLSAPGERDRQLGDLFFLTPPPRGSAWHPPRLW